MTDSQVPPIVCFATADWDAELWTNKQHMMSRLAGRGVKVIYVDSPGHRVPGVTARDIRRLGRRFRAWRPWARSVGGNIWRDSPLIIPNHSHPAARWVNRRLVAARLRRNERRHGLDGAIVWAYTPVALAGFDSARHRSLIYHCVDDVGAFPGVDSASFAADEARLVREADVCIASSRPLERRLWDLGARRVVYWPNPADSAPFTAARRRRTGPRGRPTAGFVGAVQEHKVDIELLVTCARSLPDVDFVLVGPLGLGLRSSTVGQAALPPNVILRGSVDRDQLPDVVASFDVGLIPYRINSYTAGVFPMKVYEYLAAGLPVVSTGLPSLIGEVPEIVIAESAEDFIAAVRRAIDEDDGAAEARIAAARENSWDARVDQALILLGETSGSPTPAGR